MNDDKVFAEERTINLTTFATRNDCKGLVIKKIGVFQLKLLRNSDSLTRGMVNIEGKTFPVLSNQRAPNSAQNEIGKNSCILLLDADQAFANFGVGILVDNVVEITKVANDFL